jgi:glycosyltransferase involved in cell wall biosynthesis
MKQIDVAICTRNSEKTLHQSLERVIRHASPRRLIVIDGDSSDKTVEIASRFGAEIYTDGGRGLGYARNMALELASTDLLGFVDADALIPSNWLSLCDHFRDSHVAAASGANLYGYGNPPLQRFHEWVIRHAEEDVGFVGTIVKRKVVIGVGGISKILQTYEDWELKARLDAHGYRWVWDRNVVNHHPLSMREYLKRARLWARGTGMSGVATSRYRYFKSFALSPLRGLRLASMVHPIHAIYYPMVQFQFLIGFLEGRKIWHKLRTR